MRSLRVLHHRLGSWSVVRPDAPPAPLPTFVQGLPHRPPRAVLRVYPDPMRPRWFALHGLTSASAVQLETASVRSVRGPGCDADSRVFRLALDGMSTRWRGVPDQRVQFVTLAGRQRLTSVALHPSGTRWAWLERDGEQLRLMTSAEGAAPEEVFRGDVRALWWSDATGGLRMVVGEGRRQCVRAPDAPSSKLELEADDVDHVLVHHELSDGRVVVPAVLGGVRLRGQALPLVNPRERGQLPPERGWGVTLDVHGGVEDWEGEHDVLSSGGAWRLRRRGRSLELDAGHRVVLQGGSTFDPSLAARDGHELVLARGRSSTRELVVRWDPHTGLPASYTELPFTFRSVDAFSRIDVVSLDGVVAYASCCATVVTSLPPGAAAESGYTGWAAEIVVV